VVRLQEPDYDFRKIVDEWKPAVEQELDMRIEADALRVAIRRCCIFWGRQCRAVLSLTRCLISI
jgi:hypothetical protein